MKLHKRSSELDKSTTTHSCTMCRSRFLKQPLWASLVIFFGFPLIVLGLVLTIFFAIVRRGELHKCCCQDRFNPFYERLGTTTFILVRFLPTVFQFLPCPCGVHRACNENFFMIACPYQSDRAMGSSHVRVSCSEGDWTGFNGRLGLNRTAIRFDCMASLYRLQIRPPSPAIVFVLLSTSFAILLRRGPTFLLRSAIATPRAPSDRTSELGRPCRCRLPRSVSHLGLCGMPRARGRFHLHTSSTVASHPPPPPRCNCRVGVQLHASVRGWQGRSHQLHPFRRGRVGSHPPRSEPTRILLASCSLCACFAALQARVGGRKREKERRRRPWRWRRRKTRSRSSSTGSRSCR